MWKRRFLNIIAFTFAAASLPSKMATETVQWSSLLITLTLSLSSRVIVSGCHRGKKQNAQLTIGNNIANNVLVAVPGGVM